ncbi:NmrA family NAD(P)-binding protein [Paraburkholderia strydomiana]|uniref:NmrA family NAD(P)-binding protein n=1 Tax=Paraburkholderia strydomiana TaxID=1245417 RepID=UPI001BEC3FE5|nr:NmrA family NAD(P)-binding protein [Paraburkholderia strydomiana]MBT2792813.1 NmrA family NAD(P)-binding protein [Paraburkholderia strydomiana]
MTQQKILISGAAGFTGRAATERLRKQGLPVRALVQKDDERAAQLRSVGAEVVVGNLLDLNDMRRVLDGISAAYFVYPIQPNLLDATAIFAEAAKEAEVGAIVNMSQISARRDTKSHAAINHWMGERVFDWSGVPVTHLRPTYFAQWLLYPYFLASIRDEGKIQLPFGNVKHAPIAAEDQGRLIATIVANPAPHTGKTYPLYGAVEMDYFEIAAAVSEVIGRKVAYEPIKLDKYQRILEDAGMPAFMVQHLMAVAVDYENGIFSGTDKLIETTTGIAPMTVQEFVTLHRSAFSIQ